MAGQGPGFAGLTVLTLESRRATEQATLIERFAGRPMVAPSLREVPLESQSEAVDFARGLEAGEFACAIFLTGVGARTLLNAIEPHHSRESFFAALSRTRVVARGPKPQAVLREWKVPIWITAPEPNTWREILASIDAKRDEYDLAGRSVAVLEYGVPGKDLTDGLVARGALPKTVAIYRWELPEDVEPLRAAVQAIGRGDVDVLVLTSGVQLAHLWQIAAGMNAEDTLRSGLKRLVIASIGPSTTTEIRSRGLEPDLEASHPKMGVLITEAAANSSRLLQEKRAR